MTMNENREQSSVQDEGQQRLRDHQELLFDEEKEELKRVLEAENGVDSEVADEIVEDMRELVVGETLDKILSYEWKAKLDLKIRFNPTIQKRQESLQKRIDFLVHQRATIIAQLEQKQDSEQDAQSLLDTLKRRKEFPPYREDGIVDYETSIHDDIYRIVPTDIFELPDLPKEFEDALDDPITTALNKAYPPTKSD